MITMRFKLYLFIFIFFTFSSGTVLSQKISYIKVADLEKILQNNDNNLFVINFWATWCPPCIKEFPLFEKVSKGYDTSKVDFIMVSLDFPSQVESQLLPFLKRNKVTLKVAVMMDLDYNSWIDKVDSSWQGDIPATIIFNNRKKFRQFHVGEVDESTLKKMINTNL